MPTEPLTGARIPASTNSPNVPQDIQNAVYDLADNTTPRFTTTTARDTAYSAWASAAGASISNGMSCWTDDAGYWDRIGGAWVARATSGTLSVVAGWTAYSGYRTPSWDLSSSGIVTLSGAVQRTASSFALGTSTPFQFANIPAAITPGTGITASPGTGWVVVGSGTPQVFPCRIHVSNGSSFISVVGMDSGTGTISTTTGIVNFDGVRYHI